MRYRWAASRDSRTSPPYTLSLQLTDTSPRIRASVQFWRFEVIDALVEYADARTYRKPGPLSCVVRPDRIAPHIDVTMGIAVSVPVLGCEIDDLVLRPLSAKVTLKGWLEKKSGERVQFSVSPLFMVQPSFSLAPALWNFLHL